jgi:hypothetical protein
MYIIALRTQYAGCEGGWIKTRWETWDVTITAIAGHVNLAISHLFAPGVSCLRLVQSVRCQRESTFSISIFHWKGLSLEVVSTVYDYFQQKVCH